MAYNKSKWKEQAAENQKKAHDLIHEIGQNYTRNPKQIAEMLEFSSRFYQYSLNNTKLIYSQNPNAVYVQSYEAWKKMDTHVKKGEKGIKIFVVIWGSACLMRRYLLFLLEDSMLLGRTG